MTTTLTRQANLNSGNNIMILKQMKVTNDILLTLTVIAMAMVSCAKLEISKPVNDMSDCVGVYFVEEQENIADHMLEKGTDDTFLEFEVRRANADKAVNVPYELVVYRIAETMETGDTTFVQSQVFDQSKFKKGDLTFNTDQKVSSVRIDFEGIPTGEKFYCTLNITDPQYASVYSNQLTSISFSVMMFEWNKVNGNAIYRDGALYDLFNADGNAPVLENDQVEVYERKDKKHYYRFKGVYSASYIARIAEGEEKYQENKKELENMYSSVIDPDAYIYLDATDPNKVYFPAQKTGFMDPSVGELLIASDVPEVFVAGSNSLYGKRSEDGVITFPKNGVLIGMQGGYYFTNSTGKHRIILPGSSVKDYEMGVSAGKINSEHRIPVTFTIAKDIKKIRYAIFKGTVDELALQSRVDETHVSELEIIPAEGELSITREITPGEDAETDVYTLVACAYGDDDTIYQTYGSVEFGYVKPGDERKVEVFFGVSTDDQYATSDYTSENSFKYWIRGNDLKTAAISYYPTSYYNTYETDIIKQMKLYGAIDSRTLKALNGEGISGMIGNTLRAGTSYTFIIYAENAYHSDIFVKEIQLGGTLDLMEKSYYSFDLDTYEGQKQEKATLDSYCGNWVAVSRDLFGKSNNRIIRNHWRAQKVVLSADGDKLRAHGLFPSLKTNPDIKFEYKEGRLYTTENKPGVVTVKDSTNIVPSLRFEYSYYPRPVALSENNYSYNSYQTEDGQDRKDMMTGGFVHEDVIAFVDNNTEPKFWAYLMGGYTKNMMGEENLVTYIGEAHGELLLVREGSPLLEGLKVEYAVKENPVEPLETLSAKVGSFIPEVNPLIKDTNKNEDVQLTPFGVRLKFKTYVNQYIK